MIKGKGFKMSQNNTKTILRKMIENEYSYNGFKMNYETYSKFQELKAQISKEDLADILDMAEQLNDFKQAFNDYVEAIK